MTYVFQAVLLAQSSKHGTVDLKFVKLQVIVEEFNKVDLWERLKGVIIATKLDLHHKVFHLTRALQN